MSRVLSFDTCGCIGASFWRLGMSMMELDVGGLRPREVEFTATDLVVTLVDGRKSGMQ